MNPLEKLHDIEGLDPISLWPLAIGWWIVIFAGILLGCILACYIFSLIRFHRSWKKETLKKLMDLEKQLTEMTARETVIALSEYLRRIALHRFSRSECAGLTGEHWLKWLAMHDPKQFDWEKEGVLLFDVPYAPTHRNLSIHQIKAIIQAVRNWVH